MSREKRIAEIQQALDSLRTALEKVNYADDDVWTKCLGKVKRLARELNNLEEQHR